MRGIPIDNVFQGDQIAVSTTDETLIGDFERLDVYHGLRVLCLTRVQDGRPEIREIPTAEITGVYRQKRARPKDVAMIANANHLLQRIMAEDVRVLR